ncbi:hypothetical protein TSUD_162130 [Trifolium subterraneum]|uniref:Uncharacterized protein n=1 Tax=Trifolium subterraneum TaxID=3900 RepID=A0A2Z6MRY7_TRISU|nr:hypothetical protein TSUD_162130 [Trifolium subterraneum]
MELDQPFDRFSLPILLLLLRFSVSVSGFEGWFRFSGAFDSICDEVSGFMMNNGDGGFLDFLRWFDEDFLG